MCARSRNRLAVYEHSAALAVLGDGAKHSKVKSGRDVTSNRAASLGSVGGASI